MSSKKQKRLEAKKRKVAAFLEVAKLNDRDRRGQGQTDDDEGGPTSTPPPDKKVRLSDKPLLEGDDYEALRARLRERKKRLLNLPRFDLKRRGHDASLDVPPGMRTALFPADLQAVLAYTMVGDRVPCGPFDWCKVDKWNKLEGVTCLVVEGVSVKDMEGCRDKEEFADLERIFQHKLEFVSPESYGSTVARDLSFMPAGSTKMKTMAKTYGGMEQLLLKGSAFKVNKAFFPMKNKKNKENGEKQEEESLMLRLLLSAKQMVDENYPMPLPGPLGERYQDYVLTREEYAEVGADSPMFCIDCEMCVTERKRSELARICVVDSNLDVVYHTLVKPDSPITNYLTRYSGVTAEMLDGVETRLGDVQAALRRLLPADAVLVGQSLSNDLHALRMMHPYVIDTSVIYNLSGVRRSKTKLSVLASRFLGRSIQTGGKLGHSPIEDAQAAMSLVKLKLEKGYEFGDVLLDGTVEAIQQSTDEYATTLLDQVGQNDKKVKVICQDEALAGAYAEVPGYTEVIEVVKCGDGASSAVKKAAAAIKEKEGDLIVCHVALREENAIKKVGKVSKMVGRLWKRVSAHGMLFLVCAGGPDANAFVAMAMKKEKEEEKK